jgi:hypothetical protein
VYCLKHSGMTLFSYLTDFSYFTLKFVFRKLLGTVRTVKKWQFWKRVYMVSVDSTALKTAIHHLYNSVICIYSQFKCQNVFFFVFLLVLSQISNSTRVSLLRAIVLPVAYFWIIPDRFWWSGLYCIHPWKVCCAQLQIFSHIWDQ